jgi:hypothetical protein
MISVETYMLFVAPFLIYGAGLAIYLLAARLRRPGPKGL